MTDAQHDLAVLQLTPARDDIALAQCTCGAISGPKPGCHWTVNDHGDGTVSLTPSLDWSAKGHFHVFANRVQVGKVDWEEYEDSPVWDIDHPRPA